jgi:hypothetical protein
MSVKHDPLSTAVTRLEQALATNAAGRERDWSGRVDRALAEVERAIRKHVTDPWPSDGPMRDLDRPLLPSPGVDRRAAYLRRDLQDLLRETEALRGLVRATPRAGGRPEADRGTFDHRVQVLAAALDRFGTEEVDLVQDSVTTDIGAGD